MKSRRANPVKVVGVVTYCDATNGLLFVQDETRGIFVNAARRTEAQFGDGVELEGGSDAGRLNPTIARATVKRVGRLPPPKGRNSNGV